MNWKNLVQRAVGPAIAVGVIGAAGAHASGCGEDGIGGIAEALCCENFKPGTNMVSVDWGLEGEANASFGAFMQAIGDLSVSATAMITDLAVECEAMALEMGAEKPQLTEEQKNDPAARAEVYCGLAAQAIGSLKAEGSLTVDFDPPRCEVQASAQVDCEASCSANVECEAELGNIEARCEPGKLSGTCTAECSGSCEGSANVAVNCEGTCSGTCRGDCSAGCEATVNSGEAAGECAGKCEGTCTGKCEGSCEVEAGANIECDGTCKGECSVEMQAPKCEAELTPPSAECSGSAECNAGCDASASAKAECFPPALTVTFDGNLDANIEAKIAALKLHLPNIIVIAQARAELIVGNLQTTLELAGNIQGDLNATAALCILPAIAAVEDSLVNAEASLSASVSVVGSVGG